MGLYSLPLDDSSSVGALFSHRACSRGQPFSFIVTGMWQDNRGFWDSSLEHQDGDVESDHCALQTYQLKRSFFRRVELLKASAQVEAEKSKKSSNFQSDDTSSYQVTIKKMIMSLL